MKSKKTIYILIALVVCIFVGFFIKDKFVYEIPKVYFEGDMSNLVTKKDTAVIKVKYESNWKKFDSYAEIKFQGTSSMAYAKKNFTIKLYEDESLENKKEVDLGWGKENKYCLKANWIDKTHARNVVSAKMVADVNKKYGVLKNTPNYGVIDGYPIEIYINGEFHGLYTWNIPKDAWMFDMDSENPNHIAFVAEGWNDSDLFRANAEYGSGDWENEIHDETPADYEKFNRLISFVMNSTDEEFTKDLDHYIDLDSCINYVIFAELGMFVDNIAKNAIYITYDGLKWYPILYDLDTTWGTNWDGKTVLDYDDGVDYVVRNQLWERIIKNYPNEIATRYFELREDVLSKEGIMNYFNEFKELIPEETFEKENNRWSNIPGYDYSQIEEYLDVRIPLVDEVMQNRLDSASK